MMINYAINTPCKVNFICKWMFHETKMITFWLLSKMSTSISKIPERSLDEQFISGRRRRSWWRESTSCWQRERAQGKSSNIFINEFALVSSNRPIIEQIDWFSFIESLWFVRERSEASNFLSPHSYPHSTQHYSPAARAFRSWTHSKSSVVCEQAAINRDDGEENSFELKSHCSSYIVDYIAFFLLCRIFSHT